MYIRMPAAPEGAIGTIFMHEIPFGLQHTLAELKETARLINVA
jgi:hypothetical protein